MSHHSLDGTVYLPSVVGAKLSASTPHVIRLTDRQEAFCQVITCDVSGAEAAQKSAKAVAIQVFMFGGGGGRQGCNGVDEVFESCNGILFTGMGICHGDTGRQAATKAKR